VLQCVAVCWSVLQSVWTAEAEVGFEKEDVLR